jgi:hypothetical protein
VVKGSFHSTQIRRAASPMGPSVAMWIASGSKALKRSCTGS